MHTFDSFVNDFYEYLEDALGIMKDLEEENPDLVLVYELTTQLKEEVENLTQE